MPEWHVQSSRFTGFVPPEAVFKPSLWTMLFNEEPESSTVQRSMGIKTEVGPFGSGRLTAQVQPMRIDLIHEADGMPSSADLPPVLGSFDETAATILALTSRLAKQPDFPSLMRVALGFVLMAATPDRQTGYMELGKIIDAVPDNPDATDFMYQINYPRKSKSEEIDGLIINRLSKWSVAALLQFVVSTDRPGPIVGNAPLQMHLRLEMDLSTNLNFGGRIPPGRLEPILKDLRDGAIEIRDHGDRIKCLP